MYEYIVRVYIQLEKQVLRWAVAELRDRALCECEYARSAVQGCCAVPPRMILCECHTNLDFIAFCLKHFLGLIVVFELRQTYDNGNAKFECFCFEKILMSRNSRRYSCRTAAVGKKGGKAFFLFEVIPRSSARVLRRIPRFEERLEGA